MSVPSEPSRTGWPTRLLAALTVAYAALLVFATHYPRPQDLLGRHPPSDKVLHFCSYAVLAALVTATLAAAGRRTLRSLLVAAAALAAFGAVDEVTQPLPWFRRAAEPLDWLADLAGIAMGITVVAALAAAVRGLRRR
jgi:VanZ family protein